MIQRFLNKIRLKGLPSKTETNILVVDSNGDIGINTSAAGDITGVTITADDTNTASDTAGSADFTIAGGAGIDTSVSGTTVTIAGETSSDSNAGIVELATTAEADTGTDTARAVTPAGLKSHIDARYANSIISFVGQATMVSSGNWVGTGKGGISNHTWNKDYAVNTETNGTSTAAVPKQWGHSGIRVPFACVVDGISCAIQNTGGNRQATVGLFFARAADGTTAVDWGTVDDTEPILQIHADANNEGGGYTVKPSHAEVTGSAIAMAAGDVFYPAIKLTGVTSQ